MAKVAPLDQAAGPPEMNNDDGPVKKTGKVDAARIPLDYHRHKDSVTGFKNWMTLVAFIVTTGLLLTTVNWAALATSDEEEHGFVLSSTGQKLANHGPLTNVHATLEQNCDACHVSFMPIKDENVLTAVDASMMDLSNERCNTCHIGGPHHANQKPNTDPSCSSCHIEHRGREHSLVSMDNHHCVNCHANVEQWLAEKNAERNSAEGWQAITKFSEEHHPKFKSVSDDAEDPGNIKFNHWLHLAPGLGLPGETAWNYGDLPKDYRVEYMSKHGSSEGDAANSPVLESTTIQLSCNSCHELQRPASDNSLEGLVSNRMGGTHFLPINFERHCQACHPLSAPGLESSLSEKNDSVYQLPHDLQPAELLEQVRGKLAMTAVRGDVKQKLSGKSRHPLMPGQAEEVTNAAGGSIEASLKNATTRIVQGMLGPGETCSKCHFYETPDGQTVAALSVSQMGDDIESYSIADPAIPTDWFATARFNHAAHRAWSCVACHGEALPPEKNMTIEQLYGASSQKEIMVPDISNCVECHAPVYRRDGATAGGIRHGCTDCHKYHNVDRHWVEPKMNAHDLGMDDVTIPLSKIRSLKSKPKMQPKKQSQTKSQSQPKSDNKAK